MKKGGLIFMASLSSTTAIIQQLSIQCYGDSLTAGFKLDGPFHPYAIALSAALKSAGILEPDVRHRGMPGWTAKELLNEKDSLESLDTLLQTKPAEFTIILAGTNDLGFGMDELEIVENIWGLHEIAHRHKSVTIAVSVRTDFNITCFIFCLMFMFSMYRSPSQSIRPPLPKLRRNVLG